MAKKMRNFLSDQKGLKIALLLTSTDQMVSLGLIIPIMAYIGQVFPDNPTKVSLLQTLPSLIMVPSILITGKLSEYVSKKKLIIIGTFIFSIGGIAGGLYDNIDYMLFTRVVMGIGAGMLFALPQAFIAQIFEGQERVTMIGWSAAAGSLFSVVATIIAGILGVIDWHYCFYCFAAYLLLIILQAKKLPNVPAEKKDETIWTKDSEKEALGYKTALFSIAMFIFFVFLIFFSLYLSDFIVGEGMGTSVHAGLVGSTMILVSFATASCFGILFPKLKRLIPVLDFVCLAMAFYLLSIASSLALVYIVAFILGLSAGSAGPYFMTRASISIPKSRRTLAISIICTSMFLGQFAATYYNLMLRSIVGDSLRAVFMAVSVSALFCFVVAFIYFLATQSRGDNEIIAALEEQKVEA